MDFPSQLQEVFFHHAMDPTSKLAGIVQWNTQIEDFLVQSPSTSFDEVKNETSDCNISDVASHLQRGIISTILQREVTTDDIENETKIASKEYCHTQTSINSEILFELIRAAKNLLRWHTQIFLQLKGRIVGSSSVATLQSTSVLELLIGILDQQALQNETSNQELCRNISLYLFYATYIAYPGDDLAQNALHHLIVELRFPELALRILTRSCTASLALALIRNLHNAIVSLQGASKLILSTKIEWDPILSTHMDPAPWNPTDATTIDFPSTIVSVLLWALSSDPPFPGDEDDKRGELASEILGALYAIRAGQQLIPGTCKEEIMQMVILILQLPNINDTRILQCKLSIISLLMDSDRSFGEYLYHKNSFLSLLDLLKVQVSDIINKTRVDNSATAALVPILAVLNKYASANSEILSLTKLFIFPAEAEKAFQQKVQEQRDQEKKNMGPLDAPAGTLRRELCTLLTWPEGLIKRCTGELLWTLCSSDPTEFVHRVGFGNALPLLSVKGLATMPISQ